MDIYGNVKKISLTQIVTEIWLILFTSYVSFLQCSRLGIEDIRNRKKFLSLRLFQLERYAVHFHKYPYLSFPGTPSNHIQLSYCFLSDLDYFVHLVSADPVINYENEHDKILQLNSHTKQPQMSVKCHPSKVNSNSSHYQDTNYYRHKM